LKDNSTPDDFFDWLNTVERVFKYKEMPDDRKIKLVDSVSTLQFGGVMF